MKVRLYNYKSIRHYGGRIITTTTELIEAKYICNQRDHTVLVELLENSTSHNKGHKIAVEEIDYNVHH